MIHQNYNLTLMLADDVTQFIITDKARRTRLRNRTLTLRTQRVQNRAPRQAYNDTLYPLRFTTEELHRIAHLNKSETNTQGK